MVCALLRESKHRILKKFFNSSSRLCEIFIVCKKLEAQEVKVFKDEVSSISKKEQKQNEKTEIIKYFQDYSNYAIKKIQEELIQSNNYKIQKEGRIW